MRIEIVARNYKVSDHLKEVIEMKMEKFSRYFEEETVAKFTLKQVSKEKLAMEITIFYGGHIVRSEVTSDNMYNNIDLALPKLEGQIRKHRTKLDKLRKNAFEQEALFVLPQEASSDIVKKKTFALKKITVEQAVEEMELVDHTFYAFVNDANGMVNVVYRRQDGQVGLIDLVY